MIHTVFQRQLSIIDFTLNYPPIRNNLTSASLLSMLFETDYLNYPPIRNNLTSISLLSMIIETDYNFKKKSQQFSSGPVLKNSVLSGIACLYNKTQNLFNMITFCLKDVGAICFVVSGSARVAHFTWLYLKAVTEPNSAKPTELTESSLF